MGLFDKLNTAEDRMGRAFLVLFIVVFFSTLTVLFIGMKLLQWIF